MTDVLTAKLLVSPNPLGAQDEASISLMLKFGVSS
jgi:hypothetical protein